MPKTAHEGDTCVVREQFITELSNDAGTEITREARYSYTAYVWNGTAWAAMDGNYNAENVYFDSDITITQAFGNNTINASTGRGTIACTGWNVRDLISKSFSQATSAGKNNPSPTFTGPGNIGGSSYEVGTWLNDTQEAGARSAVSFKYLDGSWKAYNSGLTAGNRVELSNVTASRELLITDANIQAYGITVNKDAINKTYTNETSAVLAPSTTATNLIPALAATDLSVQVREASYNLFTWSVSAKCNDGTVTPVNNLGDEDPNNKVPGTTWSDNNNTVTVSAGHRKVFYGYKLNTDTQLDFTNLSSDNIRKLTTNHTSAPSSYTVPVGTKQIVFALKKGLKSSLIAKDGNALNAPVEFTKITGIKVEGANKYAPTDYDVWYCIVGAAAGAEKAMALNLTWA